MSLSRHESIGDTPDAPLADAEAPGQDSAARVGRAKISSVAEISHVAFRLFTERGFDATTVDDVARAAGIGRRTFFRYFASKNDLPWGDFDALVERMRARLNATPPELPIVRALEDAVIEFNRFPQEELPFHRQRMTLLLEVPTLLAHSTIKYTEWRLAVAEFVAARTGESPDSLGPRTMGWVLLALALGAYEQWLRDEESDLADVLRASFATLERGFALAGAWREPARPPTGAANAPR